MGSLPNPQHFLGCFPYDGPHCQIMVAFGSVMRPGLMRSNNPKAWRCNYLPVDVGSQMPPATQTFITPTATSAPVNHPTLNSSSGGLRSSVCFGRMHALEAELCDSEMMLSLDEAAGVFWGGKFCILYYRETSTARILKTCGPRTRCSVWSTKLFAHHHT